MAVFTGWMWTYKMVLWLLGAMLALSGWAAGAELNQFSLFSQIDWGARRGVFLILDNRYTTAPSAIDSLKLLVAIGDGKTWQMRTIQETFGYDKPYHIRLAVDEGKATIWINSEQREQFAVGFVPHKGNAFAFDHYDWARKPAEYLVIQQKLSLTADGKTSEFAGQEGFDARRYLFNPGSGQWMPAKLSVPFTIEADFRIQRRPSAQELSPLIDRYGQVNFASWDGKIASDEQLRSKLATELKQLGEWEKDLPQQDIYGGRRDLGWTQQATGFFHVAKRKNTWWLISPEGNPCFFVGLCNAPAFESDATPVDGREFLFEWLAPREGSLASAWSKGNWGEKNLSYFAPQAVALQAQFGDDWRARETQLALRRMRAWGFSGLGKWSSLAGQTQLPVLHRDGVPRLSRHPDTFDPAVRSQFRAVLAKQITPREKDRFIIGWSLGNEMAESFTNDEVLAILKRDDGSSPAKRALIDFAVEKLFAGDAAQLAAAWKAQGQTTEQLSNLRLTPRQGDLSTLRMFLAENYFDFVYRTVKELDPNHLYFGHWILPTYWQNADDWRHVASHCDVVGFDLYEQSFDEEKVQKVIRESNKPVFCGEFGFPPYWNGERGYGRFRTAVSNEAEAGRKYRDWIRAASRNPWCVGVSFFQYRDQAVTGRGPVGRRAPAVVHGENYAFGLVDVTNQCRWDLVRQVREANYAAASWRLTEE